MSVIAPPYQASANGTASISAMARPGQHHGPTGNVILETVGVSKRFGKHLAVDDLSLTVAAGEVLGFLGPNGAGKSTTIGMILGLIEPSSGSIRIQGRDLANQPSLVAENVGAIIEGPAFYPYLSGRDNLTAHGLMVGNVAPARIEELLRLVNLGERAGDAYKTYSLGMKQRLGLASTLLTRPALVILDEPTNGLDPAGQREIREIIPRLADEGHGVLLASHMLHEVEQVSDRVLIVNRGRQVTEGCVDDLLRRGGYIEVMVPDVDPKLVLKAIRPVPDVEGVTVDGQKLVVVAPPECGSSINRALAERGMYASAITPRHHSLEQLFLELTGDPSALP